LILDCFVFRPSVKEGQWSVWLVQSLGQTLCQAFPTCNSLSYSLLLLLLSRLNVCVASVIGACTTLAILQGQADDDEHAEDDEKANERAHAAPVTCVSETIGVHDLVHGIRVDATELGDHHSLEAISDGREVHEPCYVSLRGLLEDAWKRNHVATKQVQWHVHDGSESNSGSLMVENTGKSVSHGSSRLNHEHEDEVVGNELRERVCEADREVGHQEEHEWNNEHDWNLGNKFSGCVNPDIVHT